MDAGSASKAGLIPLALFFIDETAVTANIVRPNGWSRRGERDARRRLACTVTEVCKATGLGRTKLYELIARGHLDTTTVGRRRLVMVEFVDRVT